MAEGKATMVYTGYNKIEETNVSDGKGSSFISRLGLLSLASSTCELANRLNLTPSIINQNKISDLFQGKKMNTQITKNKNVTESKINETILTQIPQEKKMQTSIKEKKEVNASITSSNFWEIYGHMIIHFILVLILFVAFHNLGIMSTVGSLLKSKFFVVVFCFLFVASFASLSVYVLEDIIDSKYEEGWFFLGYLILGPSPFCLWAQHVFENEQAQKQEEYLKSPLGQYDQLYKILIDISGISDRVARTILDQYPSFDKLHRVTIEKMCEIPGVGKNLATAIKARLNNLSN